jgi:demethoxyubiquinone hydroxylase (CLK1/Coq7/Cat5 family)
MQSSGMLRCAALVRNDVSEERYASIIRVERIGELGAKLVVTGNRRILRRNSGNVVPSPTILVSLMMEALRSSETSVLTRAKLRRNPEYGILY